MASKTTGPATVVHPPAAVAEPRTQGGGPVVVQNPPPNVQQHAPYRPPVRGSLPQTGAGALAGALTGAQRDAFVALNAEFASFGLQSLAPKIFSYIQNGYSADTIALLLQDTKEYKTRFAGNEARRKNGLAVLSPQDYLATEAAYRQIMASAGLPKNFYDSPNDYAQWIGSDVSPTEIKSRVDLATASVVAAPKDTRQALEMFYGVDDAHLTAYFLDQTKALPILQKQEQAAQFGAEAISRGLIADRQRMEDYVGEGFNQSTISQGFQTVAEELPNLQALASRWGTTFNQGEEEQAVFGTSAQALSKRRGLASQERALFNGSNAVTSGGLQQYTGR